MTKDELLKKKAELEILIGKYDRLQNGLKVIGNSL